MSKYFQDELNYLNDAAREWVRQHPKLEKYLGASATDPEVEHLMEVFAFLTARLREDIEDDLPEITTPVIDNIWPNFLRPFPPVTLMQFSPVDRSITGCQVLPAGTTVLSRAMESYQCVFRTTADCAIYPLEIAGVRLERTRELSRLHLDFGTLSGMPLGTIGMKDLRLHFTGDAKAAQTLYLWTMCYVREIRLKPQDGTAWRSIPLESLHAGGMDLTEALLPGDGSALDSHRLLREFFLLPEKFLCIDITRLGTLLRGIEGSGFTIEITYKRPVPVDVHIQPDTIRLHCVPAVNLFPAQAEPILRPAGQTAQPLRPLITDEPACEIFSIDAVGAATDANTDRGTDRGSGIGTKGIGQGIDTDGRYARYQSLDRGVELASDRTLLYWQDRVKDRIGRDGRDHELTFLRADGTQARPAEDSISVSLTCFNGGWASELEAGDVCSRTDKALSFVTFVNLTRPTPPVYPPPEAGFNWRMISNLSPSMMSLLDPQALREVLRIYDHYAMMNRQAGRDTAARLNAIVALSTKPADRFFSGRPVRGLISRMVLREDGFESEGEMYLFASILAEFFALYATTNSFHLLEMVAEKSGQVFRWKPKKGRQPLI